MKTKTKLNLLTEKASKKKSKPVEEEGTRNTQIKIFGLPIFYVFLKLWWSFLLKLPQVFLVSRRSKQDYEKYLLNTRRKFLFVLPRRNPKSLYLWVNTQVIPQKKEKKWLCSYLWLFVHAPHCSLTLDSPCVSFDEFSILPPCPFLD